MAYNLNATDMVYDFIVDRIRSGVWPPGCKIWSEIELCGHLGVSRTAVRQAIEKLATMLVLTKIQGSGTYVQNARDSSLSGLPFFQMEAEDILKLLEFRRYFEPGNVTMFIKNASSEEIEALEQNYVLMCESRDTPDRFFFYDNEFHNMIAKGTKNPYAIKVSDTFFIAMESSQFGLYCNLGPRLGVEFHRYILEYIKKRDAELACIYMKRHIDMNMSALIEKVELDRRERKD